MDPQEELGNQQAHINSDYNQMSQFEREEEFKRQHQEYIAEKQARKKQLIRKIREQFGSSSSDQDSDQDHNVDPSESSRSSVGQKNHPQQKPTMVALDQQGIQKKITSQSEKVSVLIPSKKGSQWSKQVMIINPGKSIVVNNFNYQLKSIGKIKILYDPVMGVPCKTKISYHQNQILLASPSNQQIYGLDPNYYLFAKLVQEKLNSEGVKLKEFVHEKVHGVPENLIANAFTYGKLNKKSQVLGKWQQRFIVINKDGLFSYKKFNERYSWSISSGSIKELWTRFEIQDNLLIIKIHHGSKKTEFGLPLIDFMNGKNWLSFFYSMIGKK